jgi:hypothetical protein
MQPDFDDLRFTSSDGTTELSYWLESKTDSTTATIWVKIPSLASGDNTIYMYYANASAITASNGDNTFEFFDHFLGLSLNTDKWNFTNVSGSSSIGSSIATLSISGTSSSYYSMISSNNLFVATNTIVEARIKLTSSGRVKIGFQTVVDYFDINNNWGFEQWVPSFAALASGSGSTPSTSDYKIWKITCSDSFIRSYYDGILQINYANPANTSPSRIFIHNYYTGTFYCDWIRVRKYAATEPTSSFGTEQNS